MLKDIIIYENEKIEITWNEDIDFSKLKNITQVYGVVFDENNKIIIIKINNKKWTLPGGGPEPEDSDWEETLRREILEEADLEIDNIVPIGFNNSHLISKAEEDHQQIRYIAKVKKILPQTMDPAYGIIPKRKFIDPKDFLKYCPGGKTGIAMINCAIRTNQK